MASMKFILQYLMFPLVVAAVINGFIYFSYQKPSLDIAIQTLRRTEAQLSEARSQAESLQSRINDAATKYTQGIDQLLADVGKELDRKEGPSQLIPAARALMSARDEFSKTMEDVQVHLDGDFERVGAALSSGQPDETQLRQALETLRRSWPAKKSALEIAIRKALDNLGIKPGS